MSTVEESTHLCNLDSLHASSNALQKVWSYLDKFGKWQKCCIIKMPRFQQYDMLDLIFVVTRQQYTLSIAYVIVHMSMQQHISQVSIFTCDIGVVFNIKSYKVEVQVMTVVCTRPFIQFQISYYSFFTCIYVHCDWTNAMDGELIIGCFNTTIKLLITTSNLQNHYMTFGGLGSTSWTLKCEINIKMKDPRLSTLKSHMYIFCAFENFWKVGWGCK